MLKKDEWTYLLNTRSVSHVRYHFAVVSGVEGVILYPDAYTPASAGAPAVSSGGTVTAANWQKMHLVGCGFLPAAGSYGRSNIGGRGIYWASSKTRYYDYERFTFSTQTVRVDDYSTRSSFEISIRLVHVL